MNHRVGGAHQTAVVLFAEPKSRLRQVAPENCNARLEESVEPFEIQMKLEGVPEADFGLARVLRAHQEVQRIGAPRQQIRRDMRPRYPVDPVMKVAIR